MDFEIKGMSMMQVNQLLSVLQTKHNTISENIANTNTPGYIRKDVNFSLELDKVLQNKQEPSQQAKMEMLKSGMHPAYFQNIEVIEDGTLAARADGNNVTLETEMMELAQTSQLYKTIARLASKGLRGNRLVIHGRQ